MATDSNLFFCSTPNCEEVLSKDQAKNNQVKCKKCKKSSCSLCKLPSHGKVTCSQNPENKLNKWAGNVKVHSCPKCNTKIEKDGGCPEMYCPICNFNWCWTCGFSRQHAFHQSIFFFYGFFCQIMNYFSFGFINQKKCHWTCRYLITLLMIPTAPVWVMLIAVVVFFYITILDEYSTMPLLLICIPEP